MTHSVPHESFHLADSRLDTRRENMHVTCSARPKTVVSTSTILLAATTIVSSEITILGLLSNTSLAYR